MLEVKTVKTAAGPDAVNYRLMIANGGCEIRVFTIYRNPHVTVFKAQGYQVTVNDKAHLQQLVDGVLSTDLLRQEMEDLEWLGEHWY